ncbi:putative ribonuclease H-like domain-containing protein, partial [Tanacetum coccineum]
MRPFGCHVTILNTLDHLGKFDGKSDDGLFVGYSLNSKPFRVYNIRTRKVEENLHVRFLEDKPIIAGDGSKWLFDIDVLTKSMNYVPVVPGTNSNDFIDGSLFDSSSKNARNDEPQPSNDDRKKDDEDGINDQERPENSTHVDFFGDETKLDMSNITTTYPVLATPNTRIHKDHSLDHVIGDVLGRAQEGNPSTKRSKLDRSYARRASAIQITTSLDIGGFTYGKRAIGTKWVYRNKKDERVARIEAIRLFLAYASFKEFVVYPMDVKSAFLYGKIEDEVYIFQPPGFEDPEFTDRVYNVEKAPYGLHQAPRAWYETLSTYLLDNRFQRGQIDKTLFIKRVKGNILLVQVYVDDIIFGSTKKGLCTDFEKMMHKKFQMSSMREITFFLGLQVTQKVDGIFISQDKYVDEILKKFGFSTIKIASTPMETSKPLLKDTEAEDVDVHLYRSMIGSLMYLTSSRHDIMFAYPKDSPFDLEAYTDSDYTGSSLDRKSTTGGCQFFGRRLISWQCKKQTVVANSITEAEDSYEKRLIQVIKIHTDHNVADLLTKAFDNGLEMLRMKLRLKLCCQAKVNAAMLLTTARLPLELQLLRVFLVYKRNTSLIEVLKFVDLHDMVAYLEKSTENDDFDEIVDFLNANPIRYALTSSGPTTLVADETIHEERGDNMEKAATTAASLDAEQDRGSGLRRQDTILGDRPAQTRFERLSKQSNDPPLLGVNTPRSGKDRLKIMELMEIYTKLSDRVLALKNVKTTQDLKITSLKKRVEKLEKKKKARTSQLKRRLFKVRIESCTDKSLETQGRYDQDIDVTTASAPITTAGVSISTAEPSTPPTTTTTIIEDEDRIIAHTLMKMRSEKSKEKAKEKSSEPATRPTRGVTMQEPSESGTRKALPPLQHDLKDKGK